jgi:hypothetical protein
VADERRELIEWANNPAIGYNLTPRWSVMEDDGDLFSRFAPLLRDMTEAELEAEIKRPRRLLLDHATVGKRHIEIAYFPVGHVNVDARVVIVGLTPGRTQMRNALKEAHRCLRAGCSEVDTLAAVKVFASFSGSMRPNLIAMLDSIGVNRLLDLHPRPHYGRTMPTSRNSRRCCAFLYSSMDATTRGRHRCCRRRCCASNS